ncbi:MAG: hypothetical protein ACP5UF_07325 [Hydrogenobaculum sp.]
MIKDLIMMTPEQVRAFILEQACGFEVVEGADYVLLINNDAKKDLCLVSHYDTVGNTPPKVLKQESNILHTDGTSILGGDDRAGVYACLKLADSVRYTLFCDKEEIGGLGAIEFCESMPHFTTKAFIELDRKGNNDSVYYDSISLDFEEWVESFGWKPNTGSFSDISKLTPYFNISSVNLSVGYYNAHSKREILDLEVLETNICRVKRMIDECDNRPFSLD